MLLQFGTSRFLEAHADLIISETMPHHPICVVQSSRHAATAGRLRHLASPAGYPVRIQGQVDGAALEHETMITAIGKALSTATDWDGVMDEARTCSFILSNVSEAGYLPKDADARPMFDNTMSFVAKLTLLLKARSESAGGTCTMLPLELFFYNGHHLHSLVRAQALQWGEATSVIDAIDGHIWVVDSLVDRIVSGALDPVGARIKSRTVLPRVCVTSTFSDFGYRHR